MPDFTFKIGTADFAQYVRVAKGEGLDPFDPDHFSAEFSRPPLSEGGTLMLERADLREMVFPVRLKATTKQGVHDLVVSLERKLAEPGLDVEWRDSSNATDSSFFDLEYGRFEPDFNYWRSVHNYAEGIVRLWVQPYAHTGTQRVVATAAATGPLTILTAASAVLGDGPGLLSLDVRAGSAVASSGRDVAFAVLPNASYVPEIRAASIGDRMTGATLVGEVGAAGSQYLGFPIRLDGRTQELARVPLYGGVAAYAGENRAFAIARNKLTGDAAIQLEDMRGNLIGPTQSLTAGQDWTLLDMGVVSVSSVLARPTAMKLVLKGGEVRASGAATAGMTASPALQVCDVILLPERSTVFVSDRTAAGGSPFSNTPYSAAALTVLNGTVDTSGNSWARGLSDGSSGLYRSRLGPYTTFPDGMATIALFAHRLDVTPRADLDFTWAGIQEYTNASYTLIGFRKEQSATQTLTMRYLPGNSGAGASPYLAIIAASGAATALIASKAIPSYVSGGPVTFTARTTGGAATVVHSSPAGTVVLGASNAMIAISGQPGIAGRAHFAAPVTGDFSLNSGGYLAIADVGSSLLQPRDLVRLNAIDRVTYREALNGDLTDRLEDAQRGRIPTVDGATGLPRFVALCMPRGGAAAQDLLDVSVSVRDRWKHER